MKTGVLAALAVMAFGQGTAQAVQIAATGYTLNNGAGYPDATGIELTDGFVPNRHYASYYDAAQGYGWPYVGWRRTDPSISFSFAAPQTFGSLIVWADDFSGSYGVTAPQKIFATVNGVKYDGFSVGTPLDAGYTYPPGSLGSTAPGGGTP